VRHVLIGITLAAALVLPAVAEDAKPPSKLNATKILAVKEVEPAVFEIAIELEGGAITILRMNAFTLQSFRAQLDNIGQ
jgi:hypothetical protein